MAGKLTPIKPTGGRTVKKCPYCAEEIQDEAIKCRYCMSDLSTTPGAPSGASPAASSPQPTAWGSTPAASPAAGNAVQYTHSGFRYVLGYGADFFGIWDRQSPTTPTERFPRTDDGWRDAWLRFAGLEPNNAAVPADAGGSGSGAMLDANDNDVLQYTHSGTRYLLGYGRTFFGIWDRQNVGHPTERFPRTDDGWNEAWRRYTQIEQNYADVKPPQ